MSAPSPAVVERLASWDLTGAGKLAQKSAAPWIVHNLLDAKPFEGLEVHGVDGVEGAILLENVLTAAECERIIATSEHMGFSSGEDIVSVPLSVRRNDAVGFVVDDCTRRELSCRLEAALPRSGCEGAVLSSIPVNGHWRCYRYQEPSFQDCAAGLEQRFTRHFDGSQLETQGTGMTCDKMDRATGKPVCSSQMSLLLYLNGGVNGGETVFYDQRYHPGLDLDMPSDLDREARVTGSVAPSAGSALVFWHGHHPLSPLHEGAPLRHAVEKAGCPPCSKYVVRTDVLYEAPATSMSDQEWVSSSTVQAMMWAAASR